MASESALILILGSQMKVPLLLKMVVGIENMLDNSLNLEIDLYLHNKQSQDQKIITQLYYRGNLGMLQNSIDAKNQAKPNKNSAEYVLEYWNIRGTTQALRNLLEYLQLDYEDKVLEWPNNIQFHLSDMLAYTNLPNLKHKNMQITQIVPIGKYICRSANREDLLGKTLRDEAEIDGFIMKTFYARNVYLQAMSALQYVDDAVYQKLMLQRMKVLKQNYLKDLVERFKTREFYMGYLTLADFFVYNVLFYFQGFVPSLLNDDEVIEGFMTRFEQIQNVKQYIKSSRSSHPPALSEEVNKKWKGKRGYK